MIPYRIGVAVFISHPSDKETVLIGKRKGSLDSGCWGLPGGHLEDGETIEECAKREVLEETGIEITNVKHIVFTDDLYEDEQKRYITLFVSSEVVGRAVPEIMEPDKCDEWKWHNSRMDFPKPQSTALINFNKLLEDLLVM